MCLTSFGDGSTKPPALLPCRDDAMVDKGAAASKPFLSLVEMRIPTAAGGLLLASIASTAMRTIFSRPLLKEPAGQTITSLPPPTGERLLK